MATNTALFGLTLLALALIAVTLWYIARARNLSRWWLAILILALFLVIAIGKFVRYMHPWT
jgi:hypothetical protein